MNSETAYNDKWLEMDCEITREGLLKMVREALPLAAHAKPALLTFLRRRTANKTMAPRLTVTDVLDSRDAHGPMCKFAVHDSALLREIFIAPINQIAFDRRLPLARQISRHLRILEREAKR
jgi:hypothetical protein